MTNIMEARENSLIELPKRGMPVTIITGFLGSGKTTLVNQILNNNQNLKVAVLVNEFGEINIDSQLLVSLDQDMVELSNGCICCTINGGLVDAVYRIIERKDKIDYLLVETTGIADPLPIILTFINSELRDLTRLDSVLTVVDSEAFTPEHFDSDAALNQIAYADIVLLNKVDLATEEKIKELEDYINLFKAGARMLRCQDAKVPLELILDVELSKPESYKIDNSAFKHHHHYDHDHHHHSHHLENDGFMSFSFQSERPFAVGKFQKFLDELPANVFRVKGIIWFKESQLRHIFQLSGKRYNMDTDEWLKPRSNQLVVIGRNLNIPQLQEQLMKALV